mmetsp:Transcript_54106/g.136155  ORF Transcript_54106/g.136155 Transcript_54106/m.136155 type:complete len:214 (-) Transcript_54106:1058-1699(-)
MWSMISVALLDAPHSDLSVASRPRCCICEPRTSSSAEPASPCSEGTSRGREGSATPPPDRLLGSSSGSWNDESVAALGNDRFMRREVVASLGGLARCEPTSVLPTGTVPATSRSLPTPPVPQFSSPIVVWRPSCTTVTVVRGAWELCMVAGVVSRTMTPVLVPVLGLSAAVSPVGSSPVRCSCESRFLSWCISWVSVHASRSNRCDRGWYSYQ